MLLPILVKSVTYLDSRWPISQISVDHIFQKEEKQLSKLQKVLRPDEFAAATANITNREQRLTVLDNQYKELEEHYLAVLERIAANWTI